MFLFSELYIHSLCFFVINRYWENDSENLTFDWHNVFEFCLIIQALPELEHCK